MNKIITTAVTISVIAITAITATPATATDLSVLRHEVKQGEKETMQAMKAVHMFPPNSKDLKKEINLVNRVVFGHSTTYLNEYYGSNSKYLLYMEAESLELVIAIQDYNNSLIEGNMAYMERQITLTRFYMQMYMGMEISD